MDGLLRALERQLGAMGERERGEVVAAIRGVIGGLARLSGRLDIPVPLFLRALGAVTQAKALGRTGDEVVAAAKRAAAKIGPHVSALFSAL